MNPPQSSEEEEGRHLSPPKGMHGHTCTLLHDGAAVLVAVPAASPEARVPPAGPERPQRARVAHRGDVAGPQAGPLHQVRGLGRLGRGHAAHHHVQRPQALALRLAEALPQLGLQLGQALPRRQREPGHAAPAVHQALVGLAAAAALDRHGAERVRWVRGLGLGLLLRPGFLVAACRRPGRPAGRGGGGGGGGTGCSCVGSLLRSSSSSGSSSSSLVGSLFCSGSFCGKCLCFYLLSGSYCRIQFFHPLGDFPTSSLQIAPEP
mmetsp:Transcript_35021/g.61111  ORF Transcript_35021/g.61111 Transcript_35021/m.61111 type:complete len:263 (-) Transcript_35021:513-1301(-)